MSADVLMPGMMVKQQKTALSACQAECQQRAKLNGAVLLSATPEEMEAIRAAWEQMAENYWQAYRALMNNDAPAAIIDRIALRLKKEWHSDARAS